ncbi:glycosyltransferase family 4 protein [Deinococcus sp. UYEF24]
MRILTIHNKYQIRGGEDESRESEDEILRSRGHFLDEYISDNHQIKGPVSQLYTASRSIWNPKTYRDVQQKIRDCKTDIVDVHNFSPVISPSAHYAAKRMKKPVVQTLHNFRLLCVNAIFYRDGHVCQDCLGKLPWSGVKHSCYRDSAGASAAVLAMIAAHRALHTWQKKVDVFVCLTEFAKNVFVIGGIPEEKIFIKPNFIKTDPGQGKGHGDYYIFVGRLTEEKGVRTLLEAWKELPQFLGLKIIGDGPMAETLKKEATAMHNIEFLGRLPAEQAYEVIGEARALILPSKWFETFGRVAVEAFAKGIPVIASDIGAVAEVVTENKTGYLFRPGDSKHLTERIRQLEAMPEERRRMGLNARAEFEKYYTAERNYEMMMEIYELALERNSQ